MHISYAKNCMRVNKIIYLLVSCIFLLIVTFYNQTKYIPTESNETDAITLGRYFAYSLLLGNPYIGEGKYKDILSVSDKDVIVNIIENRQLVPISLEDITETYAKLNLSNKDGDEYSEKFHLFSPLIDAFESSKNLELSSLVQEGNRVTMTFSYPLPDKKLFVYMVAVEYRIEKGGRYRNTLMSKFFSIPGIDYVSGENRLEGYWVVSDFDYESNMNDYNNWLLLYNFSTSTNIK